MLVIEYDLQLEAQWKVQYRPLENIESPLQAKKRKKAFYVMGIFLQKESH